MRGTGTRREVMMGFVTGNFLYYCKQVGKDGLVVLLYCNMLDNFLVGPECLGKCAHYR